MIKSKIHPETLVRQADGVVTAEADGDLVMMSIEQGHYYGLNPIGREIWAMITEERTVTDICAELRREFEIDEATCEHEVFEFLTELARQTLIITRDAA